jgi:predicted KAP-like P-loop ATPase
MEDLGFADDKPIFSRDQDLLGRSAFAINLAAAIQLEEQRKSADRLDGGVGQRQEFDQESGTPEFQRNA